MTMEQYENLDLSSFHPHSQLYEFKVTYVEEKIQEVDGVLISSTERIKFCMTNYLTKKDNSMVTNTSIFKLFGRI